MPGVERARRRAARTAGRRAARDFAREGAIAVTTQTFMVQGMSCAHCQATVTKALRGVPGVASAEVDLSKAQATVDYDPAKATVGQLSKAVQDAGYALSPA